MARVFAFFLAAAAQQVASQAVQGTEEEFGPCPTETSLGPLDTCDGLAPRSGFTNAQWDAVLACRAAVHSGVQTCNDIDQDATGMLRSVAPTQTSRALKEWTQTREVHGGLRFTNPTFRWEVSRDSAAGLTALDPENLPVGLELNTDKSELTTSSLPDISSPMRYQRAVLFARVEKMVGTTLKYFECPSAERRLYRWNSLEANRMPTPVWRFDGETSAWYRDPAWVRIDSCAADVFHAYCPLDHGYEQITVGLAGREGSDGSDGMSRELHRLNPTQCPNGSHSFTDGCYCRFHDFLPGSPNCNAPCPVGYEAVQTPDDGSWDACRGVPCRSTYAGHKCGWEHASTNNAGGGQCTSGSEEVNRRLNDVENMFV